MNHQIERSHVLADGLLVSLKDGREALITSDAVVACAEATGAFVRAEQFRTDDVPWGNGTLAE